MQSQEPTCPRCKLPLGAGLPCPQGCNEIDLKPWPPAGVDWYYSDDAVCIAHADCRDILPLLPKVDLVLTDPPYGFGRFETDGLDYLEIVGPALRSTWVLLKDGASMFVFSGTGQVVNLANALSQPLKRMLWLYKPADMTYPLHGWLLKSEAILWFLKGSGCNLFDRKPYRHDCYIHNRVGLEGVEGHPTVKPISVCRDIASRCPEGGTILDPFAGSGTTGRAAKDLGRKAILIEISEAYCEIAAKRMQQACLPLTTEPSRKEVMSNERPSLPWDDIEGKGQRG